MHTTVVRKVQSRAPASRERDVGTEVELSQRPMGVGRPKKIKSFQKSEKSLLYFPDDCISVA